jgi:hypothetical protein
LINFALREKLIELAGEQGSQLFLFEAPRCERLIQRIFEQIQQLARRPKGSEAQVLADSERRPTRHPADRDWPQDPD